MLRIVGPAMRSSLPPELADDIIAELRSNDRARKAPDARLLAVPQPPRLAGRRAERKWPKHHGGFGENDDVKIQPDERVALQASPTTRLVIVDGAGHFAAVEKPGQVADLIIEALGSPPTT